MEHLTCIVEISHHRNIDVTIDVLLLKVTGDNKWLIVKYMNGICFIHSFVPVYDIVLSSSCSVCFITTVGRINII
jgi:hypothetical protein